MSRSVQELAMKTTPVTPFISAYSIVAPPDELRMKQPKRLIIARHFPLSAIWQDRRFIYYGRAIMR